MKIGIIGSGGYIAEHLKSRILEDGIHKVKMLGRRESSDIYIDLLDLSEFDFSQLDGLDYLIFTAAISGPDICASKYEYARKINVTSTIAIVEEAVNRGCRVLFFSSDAVYGADSGCVFDEDSPLNGSTPYGKMKKEVENYFTNEDLFKAIRLSYVVSESDKFVAYCLKCRKEKVDAEIFHPFYRSCVTLSDVLDTVIWLIDNWGEFNPKAINVTGSELVSRVRIVDEINRMTDNRINYVINTPIETFYNNRPAITQMTSKYLWKYGIVDRESFTNKLRKQMEEIII